MKTKVCCARLSDKTRMRLDKIRPLLMKCVVEPHLHRPGVPSCGCYVQKCDMADDETHEKFVEVRMTGVTLADDRCYFDFVRAHQALEILYVDEIRNSLEPGDDPVQLFVVLMLDKPPKDNVSNMIEGKYWLVGKHSTTEIRVTSP